MKKSSIIALVIASILIIDQVVKIWVKLTIPYGGGFDILGLPWAKIHFIENEGMAFGLSLGGVTGKLILSTFRIVMVAVLFYILKKLMEAKEPMGLLIAFSMIIAGAIGNIIDSAFYGLIFSESSYHLRTLAEFMPEGGGYAGFLQGRVVDMFYFPMVDGTFPEWFPFWGGERFQFFRPVFNVADSSITVGVFIILIFYRKFFKKEEEGKNEQAKAAQPTA